MATDTPRAFDDLSDSPCPVCLELALLGKIQARGVMPLPRFPALSNDGRKFCRDCQATETMMRLGMQHPMFCAARLTVANERIEGNLMPLGMMENYGLCSLGHIRPSSQEDFVRHVKWLESCGIPNSCDCRVFRGIKDETDSD